MKYHFENEKKKEHRIHLLKSGIRYGIEILAVILLAYLLVHFCLIKTQMIGNSMSETLEMDQEVLVNKSAYLIFGPGRNDLIAFRQVEDEEETEEELITIRRVIGLPGETVQIKDGYVYIDGAKLSEKYQMTKMTSGGRADSKIVLGEGEYFVLGDNRNDSDDSRFRSFGNVYRKNIIGEVIFKVKPFALLGGPKATTKTEEK